MTSKEIIRRLLKEGWVFKNQTGSHARYYNASLGKGVTIPIHGNKDLKIGTLQAIFKQVGWK